MANIAVSNVTNALVGLAEGFTSFEQMYQGWKNDLRRDIQTVIHGDDAARKVAAQRIENAHLPRIDQYLANMSGQIGAARAVASQLPVGGSTAATTGAVQTVDGGTGVIGVPGVPADAFQTPAEGSGSQPNDTTGTGIIGQSKQGVDENAEKKDS